MADRRLAVGPRSTATRSTRSGSRGRGVPSGRPPAPSSPADRAAQGRALAVVEALLGQPEVAPAAPAHLDDHERARRAGIDPDQVQLVAPDRTLRAEDLPALRDEPARDHALRGGAHALRRGRPGRSCALDDGHGATHRGLIGTADGSSPRSPIGPATIGVAHRAGASDASSGSSSGLVDVEQPQLVAGQQHLERLPALAMVGRQPVGPDRVAVLAGGVAGVPVPAVLRVADREARASSGRGPPSRRPTRRRSSRPGRPRRRSPCTARPPPRSRRSAARRRARGRGRRPGRSRAASRGGSRGRCSAGRCRPPTRPRRRPRPPGDG